MSGWELLGVAAGVIITVWRVWDAFDTTERRSDKKRQSRG